MLKDVKSVGLCELAFGILNYLMHLCIETKFNKTKRITHMEKLQKVLDTYGRYLNSLKVEGADVKKNYLAMKTVIQMECEPWFMKHMLQDCFINALRFNRGLYDQIEPSCRVQLLMDSLENVDRVKRSFKADSTDGFSWLPLLYKYFNPRDIEETNSMRAELEQMLNNGLVSNTDFQAVEMNVLAPREWYYNHGGLYGKKSLEESIAQELLVAALA